MHVHISRSAFSKQHLFKFLTLFQSSEFVAALSRRKIEHLNEWARIQNYSTRTKKGIVINGDGTGKYYAVRTTPYTIEVRIFRGTLGKSGFYSNLEACKALFDFTRDVSLADVLPSKFIEYVDKRNHEFRHLHSTVCNHRESLAIDPVIKPDTVIRGSLMTASEYHNANEAELLGRRLDQNLLDAMAEYRNIVYGMNEAPRQQNDIFYSDSDN